MSGGDFSNEDRQELTALGFTDNNINMFQENGVNNINIIRMSLQQVNPQTGVLFTPQEIIQSIEDTINDTNYENNESFISDIPINVNDVHNLDYDVNDNSFNLDDSLNTTRENNTNDSENNEFSFTSDLNVSQGPLNLSDLNVDDENNESNNTTKESITGGNKKIRKTRKTRKSRKSRKSRKNLKRRGGGTCYGRGVGANNYDPNYTIYNTNLLKLFPYKA
jgi:hypothetical protein